MTKEEFEILKNHSEGLISKEKVHSLIKWKKSKQEIEYILDNCLRMGNPDNDFEIYFWDTPSNLTKKEKEELSRKYLLKDGHFEHEEIASEFQAYFNESTDNVEFLINAIFNIPKHLTHEDFKYPYIRKCIYAIGAQPEPQNFLGLNRLTESEDNHIKQLALHQIDKRKKNGFWEKK